MPLAKAFVYQAPKRKKSEVFWSGLTGVVLAADTDYNLVTLLKGLPAPAFGTLAPFFNTMSDKLNAYNDNASLMFKINLAGTWSAGTLIVFRACAADRRGINCGAARRA